LRIHDSQGNPLLTSAFLIPRWGGIVIKNPPKNATELGEYRLTKKELQSIIKIFISQLRSLVGIQDIDVKGLVIYNNRKMNIQSNCSLIAFSLSS
jgi:phosphatidylinositol glycan class S